MTKVFNMSAAIKLNECYDETSGGGNVDDILERLGRVESTVSEIREQVSGIAATISHLATKADVNAIEVRLIRWMIATVLTTAGLVLTFAKLVH